MPGNTDRRGSLTQAARLAASNRSSIVEQSPDRPFKGSALRDGVPTQVPEGRVI
jgi:hypothetical protein